MRRREFLGIVTGAAVAWPALARAQQLPLVVFLQRSSPIRGDFKHFRDGLAALGYEEGRNIQIEQRYAEGNDTRLRELAKDLKKLNPAVVVVDGSVTIATVQAATTAIPIVATIITDPDRFGITNLGKPGGNLTGLSTLSDILHAKRLELIKEILPQARRIAVLRAPPNISPIAMRVIGDAGRTLGLELRNYDAGAPGTWPTVFSAMKEDKCDAILQFADGRFATRITELVILAVAQRLPAVYSEREFVDAGGFASYGISFPDQWRRAAGYVDQILKGAKPGDLPVQQPTKFELVINVKTAKALGLTVPPQLLARADEVIE